MLLLDTREIGNRLLAIRKKYGMTQNEVAEASGLANRTYADIERGTVKMRVDTIIHIAMISGYWNQCAFSEYLKTEQHKDKVVDMLRLIISCSL